MAKASSTNEKFVRIMYRQAPTYNSAIKGTIFSVTDAIRLIPPMIIIPTKIIINIPIIVRALPPSMPNEFTSCIAAWLD